MQLDLTTFEDLKRLAMEEALNNIFALMRDEINAGGTILIERRYINAKPDLELAITTPDQLKEFIEKRSL
ncbi:hypothetical protein [Pedobacter panaciterrae]